MTGRQRDELVEARANFILAGAHTAKAFAEHFEVQMHGGEFEAQMPSGEFEAPMHRGKVRKLLAPLRFFCRKGVILLAVMLAPCALLGYAAFTPGPAPVWVAHQGSGTVSRIDPRTDQVTPSVSLTGGPAALAIDGDRIWTGIQRTAVTADGNTGVKFPGFPRGR